MENYNLMSDKEINDKIRELGNILNCMFPMDDKWDETYKEYMKLSLISDERYRERNQKILMNFIIII